MDETASEKFLKLLKVLLKTLSQLLEMSTIQECGRIAEELLQYLQTCANFEPVGSINCVQQLLKCLFGTNLCAQSEEILLPNYKKETYADVSTFLLINILRGSELPSQKTNEVP